MKEFRQVVWDAEIDEELAAILQAAVPEDLGRYYDWTTVALVPQAAQGAASIVSRQGGVMAGIAAAPQILEAYDPRLAWQPLVNDGAAVAAGQTVGRVSGPARSLLTTERVLLNVLSRLSGIATLTSRYVQAVRGTAARVYDTRKTTPGWRRLEKYAVRCGGGHNHRLGLHEAVLIKDNHLAFGAEADAGERFTPAEAVRRAREFVAGLLPPPLAELLIIEVEVDSLWQLEQVLPAVPDIVLLDNFSLDQLRAAVALRDAWQTPELPRVELEASGGVNLETIAAIAATGVERISAGALTHHATWLDLGLDWHTGDPL